MWDSSTLSNLHSVFCNSFYYRALYNFNKDPLITAWRKCVRVIIGLSNTTHNYIISNLDYNIMIVYLLSLFIIFCMQIISLFS